MKRTSLVVLSLAALIAPASHAATITWSNASGGSWSNAANWSPAAVPSSGDVAVLPALASAYSVTADVAPAATELQVANGATLDLGSESLAGVAIVHNAGAIANFRGAIGGNFHNESGGLLECAASDSIVVADSSIVNDGTIVVGPNLDNALHLSYNTTFSGSGTIRIEGLARISSPYERPNYSIWFNNGSGHTLTGAGDVWVPVHNYGRILQNTDGGPKLVLHQVLYNYGLVRVEDGGFINVDCPLVKQYGGSIEGRNGTFYVVLPFHGGGTMDNINGGTIVADGGDLHMDLLQIVRGHIQQRNGSGAVVDDYAISTQFLEIDPGGVFDVAGLLDLQADKSSIINNGTIRVPGTLNIDGDAGVVITVTGNGQILLAGGTLNTPANATLLNAAGHTIAGCGTITANIDNQGTISTDCSGYQGLTLKTGKITNRGLIALLKGKLVLHGNTLENRSAIDARGGTVKVEYGGTLDNRNGTLTAAADNLFLGWKTPASTILGGTLHGAVQNVGQAVLQDVTLAQDATLRTIAGATTRASGARFANQGVNEIATGGTFAADAGTAYDQIGTTALTGGTLKVPAGFLVEGMLRGAGTIVSDLTNEGMIAPEGAGLVVQGAYRQTQVGAITAPLGGTQAALRVTGAAALGGRVTGVAPEGFAPAAGALYPVMSFGSHTGSFAQVDGGAGLTVSPVYDAGGFGLAASGVVGVPDSPALPARLALIAQANALRLELPADAQVDVRAYDVTGRQVAVLAHGALPAGVHPLSFASLGRGIYFARAIVGAETRTAKFLRIQ